ncbi:hypothetical protein FALBO_16790 [Fusarium albosuccineum]|uniref:Uncharacterized protein n=1 Tax=Fusarium albosuccineum TaxID=1237068 RepID=A0A8H4NXR3_9HYPO|nr:hypothetical protein FALBO_16790 [Fusarium albosuccineum]
MSAVSLHPTDNPDSLPAIRTELEAPRAQRYRHSAAPSSSLLPTVQLPVLKAVGYGRATALSLPLDTGLWRCHARTPAPEAANK